MTETKKRRPGRGGAAGTSAWLATRGQFTADGPEIPHQPGRYRRPCPQCAKQRSDDALSILVDPDGSACWYCWRCGWSGGMRGVTRLPTVETRPRAGSDRNAKRLRRLWRESEPLDLYQHFTAALYLKNRGLDVVTDLPRDLRYHPRLTYWKPAGDRPMPAGEYPAILAAVRAPDGEPVGIHRSYLRADGTGKADVASPRKLCPPARPNGLRGAAIRLYPPGPELALAEGIETALAVRQATGRPTWSCVSAHGLATVGLPAEAEDVLIAADHDPAGIQAAHDLARRLTREGRIARVAVPGRPGTDWLDEVAA